MQLIYQIFLPQTLIFGQDQFRTFEILHKKHGRLRKFAQKAQEFGQFGRYGFQDIAVE